MIVRGDISPYELQLLNQELTMRKTHEIPKNTQGSPESVSPLTGKNPSDFRGNLLEVVLETDRG